MNHFIRFTLGIAVLFPADSLLAANGDVRVAVVVDMTQEGRKVAHPTPANPVYYLPVVIGFKQVGSLLTQYQRPPPPAGEVQRLLAKALADQGYRVATKESPPSLVLVFRWGYVAPEIVMGQWLNRDEMMTYLAGDHWRDMDMAAMGRPQDDELLSSIDATSGSSGSVSGPYGNAGTASASYADLDVKSRYFMMVSALDYHAFQKNRSVLLWREHVSILYWGHYLDESLPTLIAAGAPLFGRETGRPQMSTLPTVPLGHVVVGTPVVAQYFQDVPAMPTINTDRLQAETDQAVTKLAEGAEAAMLESSERGNSPAEAPRSERPNQVVSLPPYIVTSARSPIRWHYASVRGFEILSCCNTAATENFAQTIYRQKAWLDEMVPPSLQWNATVPTSVILLSGAMKKELSEAIASLARANAGQVSEKLAEMGGPRPEAPASILIPQVELSDSDSVGVDIVIYDPQLQIAFDPDYVFFLLARRAPALPPWFMAGISRLYQDRADAAPTSLRPSSSDMGDLTGGATPFANAQDKLLYFPPFSEDLARDNLLPMRQLLAGPPAATGADDDKRKRQVWIAQSVLFVRWALEDPTGARRKALWKFVERASTGPVTEADFRQCFGLGFAETEYQLRSYLETATSRILTLVPQAPLDSPWVEARDPTEAEEARILGDWQRKEVEFIKPTNPDYVGKYATQAEHTLMRAYNEGVRDPALLAALGLYECAVGDDGQARIFLEAAVAGQVARPRAYVELARIRLNAALAQPAGARGELDRGQVASVLDLLRSGEPLRPPQLASFLIAAETWEHADFTPTPVELRMLDEGLYFFPSDLRLVLAAAQLDARAGLKNEAIGVLDRGLQKASDPSMRHLFLTLQRRYMTETGN